MTKPNNNDSPNTPKVNAYVAKLKEIREKGSMLMGWDEGMVEPPCANCLEKAGLVRIEVRVVNHANVRTVYPVPQS